MHVSVRLLLAIFGVTESKKRMSSFLLTYGSKDELAEAYRYNMPKNKRGKLNSMAIIVLTGQ